MTFEPTPLPLTTVEDESILTTTILRGAAALSDAQVLASLLEGQNLTRAENLLREAGSLDHLENLSPLGMDALGLQECEITRLMLATEFATRAIRRNGRRKLGTLEETVRELRLRAQAWPRTVIGLIGVDPCKRMIVDKVVFEGTLDWTPVNLPGILRETLRAGCAEIVLYRWAPMPEVAVGQEDRRIADELRVMGSVLGITLIDYLVIAEQSYWSGRCDDGWDA